MKICVWPDGTMCDLEDIEEYSWMSDDYAIKDIDTYPED